VAIVAATAAGAQPAATRPLQPATATLDTLRQSPGPAWRVGESDHFIIHLEQPTDVASLRAMGGSLEVAWIAATKLLRQVVSDTPRTNVFVTRSRTRFAGFLVPIGKGLTTRLQTGEHIILLIQNDSVRAYARHEVMHLVSMRAWGLPAKAGPWIVEGLA